MGLDMYSYFTSEEPNSEVDFIEDEIDDKQIWYWRKHPNLHGWMEKLYKEKNGKNSDFNNSALLLNEKDINKLIIDIINKNLPFTQGFLFGESKNDKEERLDDLKFCVKALDLINNGYFIYYIANY